MESPSLEIFKTHLDKVLCSLLWVTLLRQGVGLGDPQRSLPTPNHSVNALHSLSLHLTPNPILTSCTWLSSPQLAKVHWYLAHGLSCICRLNRQLPHARKTKTISHSTITIPTSGVCPDCAPGSWEHSLPSTVHPYGSHGQAEGWRRPDHHLHRVQQRKMEDQSHASRN